jgi:hypothetical protein
LQRFPCPFAFDDDGARLAQQRRVSVHRGHQVATVPVVSIDRPGEALAFNPKMSLFKSEEVANEVLEDAAHCLWVSKQIAKSECSISGLRDQRFMYKSADAQEQTVEGVVVVKLDASKVARCDFDRSNVGQAECRRSEFLTQIGVNFCRPGQSGERRFDDAIMEHVTTEIGRRTGHTCAKEKTAAHRVAQASLDARN